jgi:preprotein translocase subunit SecY
VGAYIPTPGIATRAFSGVLYPERGRRVPGLLRSVQRRHVAPHDDLCAGYHAVHYGVDHSAAADGGDVPTLDKLQKEGELGRRKITQWTRYLTVVLAVIQSVGIALALQNSEGNFVLHPGFGFIAMTI